MALAVRDLEVAELRLGSEVAEVFGLDPDTPAWTITRTILADREPVAVMRDVVRPGVPLPSERTLRAAIEAGEMVIDVLLGHGTAIAFAVTHVRPLMLTSRERLGRALGVQVTTAVLQLEEIMHVGSGEAVQHSSDTFAPGGIDLHVRRNLEIAAPVPLVRAAGRA